MFKEIKSSKGSLAKRKLIYGVALNDSWYNVNYKSVGVTFSCPYYTRWVAMLRRCYSSSYKAKKTTYRDCSCCDDWLVFSVFRSWMEQQDWEGKELDKDIRVRGNKLYSPTTCLFVSTKDNTEKALAKKYVFKSPDGEVVMVYNLNEFCRVNGLCQSALCNVHSGKNRTSKGWSKG